MIEIQSPVEVLTLTITTTCTIKKKWTVKESSILIDHVCQVKCNGSINFQKSYRTTAVVEKLLEIEKEKQKQKQKTHTQTKTKNTKKSYSESYFNIIWNQFSRQ